MTTNLAQIPKLVQCAFDA
uniref:Uncharacterized protein n=1 Tax=Anguilla anguilla TaxID=7936 RepID=A0A0E9XGG5_ANGAN